MRKIARMSVKLRCLRKNLNREPIKYVVQHSHVVPHYLVIRLNLSTKNMYTCEFIELADAINHVSRSRKKYTNCEYIIVNKDKNKFLKFNV
jgi:hypothetical protein